jgi:hypothetical protein
VIAGLSAHAFIVDLSEHSFPPYLDVAAIGRALSFAPIWAEIDQPVVVSRPRDQLLAVFGVFGGTSADRIQLILAELGPALGVLRYVDYQEVEHLVEELGSAIVGQLGESADHASYMAMPRGGLIVLGMLAYVMGLDDQRLESPDPQHPLVIVDDLALSGTGFRQFLRRLDHPDIVFAHLFSHPELRQSIQQEELQVRSVLAAADLDDHGSERFGSTYPEWQTRWQARNPDTYWMGYLDHLCLPWTEPDWAWIDSADGSVQTGARLLPPALCLKHRAPTAGPSADFCLQPEGHGPLAAGPGVVFCERGGELLIAGPHGVITLNDTAARMWLALIERGSIDAAADILSDSFDTATDQLTKDLSALVAELTAIELLA